MIRFHVLSEGFTTPNGSALLFPLLVHRGPLRDAGVEFRWFRRREPALLECDVLGVDSKVYRTRWGDSAASVLEELEHFGEQVPAVLFFDTGDSSGWLVPQALRAVTRYCKAQLLRERSEYARPMYAHRAWTDFYHRHEGVTDANPSCSEPLCDPGDLSKLCVSWNSGLADYSLAGPLKMWGYRRTSLRALLRFSRTFHPAKRCRSRAVSCRMGISYPHRSVRWQRERIAEILLDYGSAEKLSRRAYFNEMAESKIVVSPFGLGEITLKDFEALLCGSLLLKPDMGHIETYPDLFEAGVTYASHRWDLSDLREVIEAVLGDWPRWCEVAETAQARYLHHIGSDAGVADFCTHVRTLLGGSGH